MLISNEVYEMPRPFSMAFYTAWEREYFSRAGKAYILYPVVWCIMSLHKMLSDFKSYVGANKWDSSIFSFGYGDGDSFERLKRQKRVRRQIQWSPENDSLRVLAIMIKCLLRCTAPVSHTYILLVLCLTMSELKNCT